jgi:hypothetical protein
MKAKRQPAKFDRCVKAVKKHGGAVSPYAVCSASLKRKKGNPADSAAQAFKDFHGYDSKEIVTVKQRVHRHEHLASAGDFEGFLVKPIDGGAPRTLHMDGALLTFNEARNQLFVSGGNQSMSDTELNKWGIASPHELETIGKILKVGYYTDKTHLGSEGGKAIYTHTFRTTNKAGRHVHIKIARSPILIYRVLDQQFEISGGSYDIKPEGIDK